MPLVNDTKPRIIPLTSGSREIIFCEISSVLITSIESNKIKIANTIMTIIAVKTCANGVTFGNAFKQISFFFQFNIPKL